ncbi:MAG: HupE/UreJ family protein [Acidobacteria bacterium]|nr:HupE/UreJ family protein [Acidobacteriota bacterium]
MFLRFLLIPFAAALCLVHVAALSAHDIPLDVAVHMLVKPEGDRLQLLVRMPLQSIRDVEFPEFGPGYLDIDLLAPQLTDLATLWIANDAEIYENGRRLPLPRIAATQISIPSDRSFSSADEAVAHITQPLLSNSVNVVWNQVWFDVLLEYPISSDQSAFSMRPGMERLAARVVTTLRFLPPGGAVRAYEFDGDPGVVPLDPRWHQAAWRFVESGFFHILSGADHLLFLLCLVIPFRRIRPLIGVVTAFTIAHSLTLAASAYGLAPDVGWFPPLIETLIALSIVWMALENIVGVTPQNRRWMFALGFGLVHGFGFSFALGQTLQFAGEHLLTSLLAFNVGVEIGQLLVLIVLVPALALVFRYVVAERIGTIILSAIVAHTAWHWMMDRGAILARFDIQWSADILLWLAALVAIAAAAGAAHRYFSRPKPV